MTLAFQEATKTQCWLRLCLSGVSGCGKTKTALRIANGLAPDSIAVIDSERKSASKYAGKPARFQVIDLDTYEPQKYIEGIKLAARLGFKVLIIDSLSHAWAGTGGILEQVDRVAKRKQNNSYVAWGEVTPIQNALIDTILSYPGHIIVTLRVKMAYALETNEKGKQTPVKRGLAPIQREGMEYEFDLFMDLDSDNWGTVVKTRIEDTHGLVIHQPGEEFAAKLLAWLEDGAPMPEPAAAPKPEPVAEAPDSGSRRPPSKAPNARVVMTAPGHPKTPGEWVARIAKAYPNASGKAAKAAAEARDQVDAMQKLAVLWAGLQNSTTRPLPKSDLDSIRSLARDTIRRGVSLDAVRALCESFGATVGMQDPTHGLSDDVLVKVEQALIALGAGQ